MYKLINACLVVVLFLSGGILPTGAATAGSTSRTVGGYTITFTFDKAYECGRFVNGEPWVVGPVTITGISPDGESNAAESNPSSATAHGIMYGWDTYAASKNIMTQLPYTAQAGESIIKRVYKSSGCGTAETEGRCSAAFDVLTVLAAAPQDDGATVFRPPFAGTDKPLRTVDKVMFGRLPRIQIISDHPSQSAWSAIVARWNSPSYELCHEDLSQIIRAAVPMDVVGNDYAATIAGTYLNDLLSTFGTESDTEKAPAVYALMQQGFDILAIYGLDISLGSGAGQHLGKKPMAVYAAALYDDPQLVELIRGSAARDGVWFQEDDQIRKTPNSTTPIWGDCDRYCGEEYYWAQLFDKWNGGADNVKTCGDPYGYIDGPAGNCTNASYQYCCSAGPFASFVFAQHLMPWMEYANNDEEIVAYVDRIWNGRGIDNFTGGWWAQPDPCAPPDSRESADCQPHTAYDDGCIYYKKTWGPDPANPGDCIKHNGDPLTDGRWSSLHGTYAAPTVWDRLSLITLTLWTRYRDCADPDDSTYPCAGMGPEVEGSGLFDALRTAVVKGGDAIRVSPNPSTGYITINGDANRFLVYSHDGRLITDTRNGMAILQPGVYLVTDEGRTAVQRVMVVK